MRRLILEEPESRPARWSPKVAWLAIVITLMSVLLIRTGRIDYDPGFTALGVGLALGALAIILSLIGLVRIWQEGRRGLSNALKGVILALCLLGYPAWLAVRAATLPRLGDVTTDTENPPSFSRSRAVLAARDGIIPPEVAPETREVQREAYEQIAPLSLDMSAGEAFALVGKAARNLGWTVIEEQPPNARTGAARLDAIDRTLVLKLPEDVTVRVRPKADGARIDLRSASRVGPHDLGSNARRIRAFLDEVSTLAIAAK